MSFYFNESFERGRDRGSSPPPFGRGDPFNNDPRYGPSAGGRPGGQGSDYYARRMQDLFTFGIPYLEARMQVEREMAGGGGGSSSSYAQQDEGYTRSRQQHNNQFSEYGKRRMEELFQAGVDFQTAFELVLDEEAERNARGRPPPRPRSDSPPRRRRNSFTSPYDEGRPRRGSGDPLSDYAKQRMEDLHAAGMDYETARKTVEREEAERGRSGGERPTGKRDLYSDWDSHPNMGGEGRYRVSREDMKGYVAKMESLVGSGMPKSEAMKIIDEEIHNTMRGSGRAPGSGSFYDPPPRDYSSSSRRRDDEDRYGSSRRGREDERRYGF